MRTTVVPCGPLAASLAPPWAVALARAVLADARWSPRRIERLELVWRRARTPWSRMHSAERAAAERSAAAGKADLQRLHEVSTQSSGSTWWRTGRIVVTAGAAVTDQRLVLLHELAHVLTPQHHHDRVFWARAWRLYLAHDVPIDYALERERTTTALRVAVSLGLPGAVEALARHTG